MKKKIFLIILFGLIFSIPSAHYTFAMEEKNLTINDAKQLGSSLAMMDKIVGTNRSLAQLKDYIKLSFGEEYLNDEEWVNSFVASYKAQINTSNNETENWEKAGELAGEKAGIAQGLRDAYYGLTADPYRSLPDKNKIIIDYNLQKLNLQQLDEFIKGFNKKYLIEYDKSYRDAYNSNYSDAGKSLGGIEGESQALIDFNSGLSSDATRNLPTDYEIISKFNLDRLPEKERKTFINSYKEEYINKYNNKYKELFKDESSEILNPTGKKWYTNGDAIGKSDGEKQASLDQISGAPKNPYFNMPSEGELISTYNLNRLDSKDIKLFLEAYKKAYIEAYNKKYDEGLIDVGGGEWSKNGEDIGKTFGENQATKDFYEGLNEDPYRSMPSDGELNSLFNLNKINLKERKAFIDAFKNAFISEYQKKFSELLTAEGKNPITNGGKDGKTAGEEYAKIMAQSHYQNGKKPDKNSFALSDSEIIAKYNLSLMDEEYKSAFIASFKAAYNQKYDEEYRKAANDEGIARMKSGFENGKTAGEKAGEKDANIDIMKSLPYSPERNILTREKIISEFNLALMETTYAEDFVAGFLSGYKAKYNEIYKQLQGEMSANKRESKKITIAGDELSTSDNRFKVTIKGGSYYDDVFLTITELPAKFLTNLGFIEASKPYRVEVTNPNGNFNKKHPVEVSFAYYGDAYNKFSSDGQNSDVGIYMLEGRNWKYVESKLDKDTNIVTAKISPQSLDGGGAVFALLVDKSYNFLYDIRGHWGKEEINAMIRRGIIVGYSDKTFRPDKPITRAEFLTLLSRHYEWPVGEFSGFSNRYNDNSGFGYYRPYIDYGTGQGYIIGYTDGSFKPNRNISYEEINWIMQRITGNYKFTWQDYAKMLVNKKGIRSKSYDSMKNKITRAEFSYLIYEMDKWKY